MYMFTQNDLIRFVDHVKSGAVRCVEDDGHLVPMGFVFGRVNPDGAPKKNVRLYYSKYQIYDHTRLIRMAESIQKMAVDSNAEAAGAIFRTRGHVTESDRAEMDYVSYRDEPSPLSQDLVMVHLEHLLYGHSFWYAPIEIADGKDHIGEFIEVEVSPSIHNPSFLPIELYGPVIAEA